MFLHLLNVSNVRLSNIFCSCKDLCLLALRCAWGMSFDFCMSSCSLAQGAEVDTILSINWVSDLTRFIYHLIVMKFLFPLSNGLGPEYQKQTFTNINRGHCSKFPGCQACLATDEGPVVTMWKFLGTRLANDISIESADLCTAKGVWTHCWAS